MIDLNDTTFIIPVRIESNDRYRNLLLSTNYLLKNTTGKIIILESGPTQYVDKILEKVYKLNQQQDCSNRVKYVFEQSNDPMFHRTRILNDMLFQVETNIVVNYDCDVVLPLSSYETAAEMCRNDCDLVYPYSYGSDTQLRVNFESVDQINKFIETSDLTLLTGFNWASHYGFAQFFKTKSYIDGGLENESLISWSPDDSERYYRFGKLGYKIGRVDGKIYHFEHSRTLNSANTNPWFRANEELFERLKKMSKEELRNYYENQECYKKYKENGFK